MAESLQSDVIIVGAGLAGLLAARLLQAQGLSVIVLDKGQSVGGRLATRRVGPGRADHGTQFFTIRDPEFQAEVDPWQAKGLVFEWSRGWSDGSLMDTRDGHPRYAIKGGFIALAKHLAQGQDIRLSSGVASVAPATGRWRVQDEHGKLYSTRGVLMTPPVPQTLVLLSAGRAVLNPDDWAALKLIAYAPCLTGVFWIEGEIGLPSPGAIQRPNAPVRWIADNHRKGISPDATVVTLQAGEAYSRQLWENSDDEILTSFRVDLLPFLGKNARIVEAELKRWRYAAPTVLYPERCLVAADVPPLVFAGDAFGEPRVEGAALSGLAAGRALVEKLNK